MGKRVEALEGSSRTSLRAQSTSSSTQVVFASISSYIYIIHYINMHTISTTRVSNCLFPYSKFVQDRAYARAGPGGECCGYAGLQVGGDHVEGDGSVVGDIDLQTCQDRSQF